MKTIDEIVEQHNRNMDEIFAKHKKETDEMIDRHVDNALKDVNKYGYIVIGLAGFASVALILIRHWVTT